MKGRDRYSIEKHCFLCSERTRFGRTSQTGIVQWIIVVTEEATFVIDIVSFVNLSSGTWENIYIFTPRTRHLYSVMATRLVFKRPHLSSHSCCSSGLVRIRYLKSSRSYNWRSRQINGKGRGWQLRVDNTGMEFIAVLIPRWQWPEDRMNWLLFIGTRST